MEHACECDDIAVGALTEWLEQLVDDPAIAEREEPAELEIDGDAIGVHDLAGAEIVLAVRAVIDADGDELLESSLEYIERDATGGDGRTPIVTIALDHLRAPTPTVERRLREHRKRRETRASDVDGLF
jgi:hypothetical protein